VIYNQTSLFYWKNSEILESYAFSGGPLEKGKSGAASASGLACALIECIANMPHGGKIGLALHLHVTVSRRIQQHRRQGGVLQLRHSNSL
jgi:hypothetical protein